MTASPAGDPTPVVYLAAVRWLAATLSIFVTASFGCGYKAVEYGAGIDGIRTLAIETPSNDSYVPGVEYVVADALRREFLRRGAVRLIETPSAADMVLGGRVRNVWSSGRSFSSVEFTLEFQLVMILELEARMRDGTSRPISERSLREVEHYTASADVEATRKNRDEAVRRVSGILAQRVHDSLFEAAIR
jgi:hypothetical protein